MTGELDALPGIPFGKIRFSKKIPGRLDVFRNTHCEDRLQSVIISKIVSVFSVREEPMDTRLLAGNDERKAQLLEEIIQRRKDERGALIPVLHEAQEIYGYLPLGVQKRVAEGLGIPLCEVYGVVTFYSLFSLEPKGQHHISVCLGTACYVKGAQEILYRIQKELNLEVGKCTNEGKFSLQACRCIGACGLAPIILINEDVYGSLTPDEIPGILAKYK